MRTGGPKTETVLSWDDLRTALFLGREGSVRRASRTLDVSHSTVLRRIADLEKAAGVRLFDKKPEGYELTPAGQDVFDTAKDLEQLVTALERRVHGRDARLSGPVRVTLPDSFLPMLAPVVADFGRVHPEIETTLVVGTSYADLAGREADIAIRLAAEPPPDLVGRRVGTAMVGIYGSAKYLARRSGKALEAFDWVGWDAGSAMSFARWMDANVPKARIAMRVSHGWALRDAVDAHAGVAVMPCALGEHLATWRRVKLLPELAAPMWILTHKDLRTSARVRVLRDALVDAVLRRRALVEGGGARRPRTSTRPARA